jgi:hypothetical protein
MGDCAVATIDIKLSQTAFDHQPNNTPATFVDGIEHMVYLAANYGAPTSWSLSGTTLVLNYQDGSAATYSGFVNGIPGASFGTTAASGYQFVSSDGVLVFYAGKLNFDYTAGANSFSIDNSIKGSVINSVGFTSLFATTDPLYNTAIGNFTIQAEGTLNVSLTGGVDGTINQLSFKSEKNLLSDTIDGSFHISGSLMTDGTLTHSRITGTLTGYHEAYIDGSHLDVSGLATSTPTTVDLSVLENPANFGSADTINIDLPSLLDRSYLIASGAGDDQLSIKGGGGALNVDAGDGNDRITLLGDAHKVDGGKGIDTVILQSPHADIRITHGTSDGSYFVTDKLGVVSGLTGVERIQFSDAIVALDVNGSGGQAYRLYQAAFARTPDKAGLGFWIDTLDKGASLLSVSQGFVASSEFKQAYGASLSDHDLVVQFYQNILHRAPEDAGLNYWVGLLDNKQSTVAEVLLGISESAENKAALIGIIGNGFEFTPYHP